MGAGGLISGLAVSGVIRFNDYNVLWGMIMLINTAYYFSQCVLIPTYDFVLRWCEQRHNFRMEEIEQEYRHNKEKQELEHRQNIENQIDPKELYEKKYETDRDYDHEYRMVKEKLKSQNSGGDGCLQETNFKSPPDTVDFSKYI